MGYASPLPKEVALARPRALRKCKLLPSGVAGRELRVGRSSALLSLTATGSTTVPANQSSGTFEKLMCCSSRWKVPVRTAISPVCSSVSHPYPPAVKGGAVYVPAPSIRIVLTRFHLFCRRWASSVRYKEAPVRPTSPCSLQSSSANMPLRRRTMNGLVPDVPELGRPVGTGALQVRPPSWLSLRTISAPVAYCTRIMQISSPGTDGSTIVGSAQQ